jgi:hypothetical protein
MVVVMAEKKAGKEIRDVLGAGEASSYFILKWRVTTLP